MKNIKILITNQHTENIGDESAMFSVINSFIKNFDKYKFEFDILLQSQDLEIEKRFLRYNIHKKININYLHMKMSYFNFLLIIIDSFFKFFKFNFFETFIPNNCKQIIKSYKDCNFIISAPGGPYIGDIYHSHEILHIFYIIISKLYKKKIYLYSPSCGPFNKKYFNPLRRSAFNCFNLIFLRDQLSYNFLSSLKVKTPFYLTCDTIFQDEITKTRFPEHISLSFLSTGNLTFNSLNLNEHDYIENLVSIIKFLTLNFNYDIYLYPQLYGKIHNDIKFYNKITSFLSANEKEKVNIISDSYSSYEQRGFLANSVLNISSRYHPTLFAIHNQISFISIIYQHKQEAFLKKYNLLDRSIRINDLDSNKCKSLINKYISVIKPDEFSFLKELNYLAKKPTILIFNDYIKNI